MMNDVDALENPASWLFRIDSHVWQWFFQNIIPGVTPSSSVYPVSSGISPIVNSQNFCQSGLERCCPPNGYSCGIRYPPVSNARTPAQGQAVNIRMPKISLNLLDEFTGLRIVQLARGLVSTWWHLSRLWCIDWSFTRDYRSEWFSFLDVRKICKNLIHCSCPQSHIIHVSSQIVEGFSQSFFSFRTSGIQLKVRFGEWVSDTSEEAEESQGDGVETFCKEQKSST